LHVAITDTVDLIEAASVVSGSEQFTTPLGIFAFGAFRQELYYVETGQFQTCD